METLFAMNPTKSPRCLRGAGELEWGEGGVGREKERVHSKQVGCDAVVYAYIMFVLDRTNLMTYVSLVQVHTLLVQPVG